MSEKLEAFRVRHAMLLTAHMAMKHYIECVERGYLGSVTQYEQEMIQEMRKTLQKSSDVCAEYFEEEKNVLGD